MPVTRRQLFTGAAATAAVGATVGAAALWSTDDSPKPNVILIFTDDQGYNDVGCFWTPGDPNVYSAINTPTLDQMAKEGIKGTNFYVAASICTPSRAALLTGRYPPAVGFGHHNKKGVFTPTSRSGLNDSLPTLGKMFQSAGYQTACIGKWHLGHKKPFLPTNHGFHDFFGIPWSNNQHPLPLMRNEKVLKLLPKRPILTDHYTNAAIQFLEWNKKRPFFLYLAHSAPHEPWAVPKAKQGMSQRGLYGDVVEGIDRSTATVLATLEKLGLTENTLVIFTSDNGPWLDIRGQRGSAFPLRGGKAQSYEGGVRTPFIAKWPGVLPEGQTRNQLFTTLDLFATFCTLTGQSPPKTDGFDMWEMLTQNTPSPREHFAVYARGRLEAIRDHRYKLMFPVQARTPPTPQALFDLQEDIGETTNIITDHPTTLASLNTAADALRAQYGDALRGIKGTDVVPLVTLR